MKRFLLFQGLSYYPCGGVYDFINSFDTFEEATSQSKEDIDWQNILDVQTGKRYIWIFKWKDDYNNNNYYDPNVWKELKNYS